MKKKRLDISIRFQPFFGTPEEKILTYLKKHQINSAPALAMQAMRPYWLPLTILEDEETPFKVKQQIARNAIRELLLHIEHITSTLGLERIQILSSNTQDVFADNELTVHTSSHKNQSSEKLSISHLESNIGNGEWGNLGSFDE